MFGFLIFLAVAYGIGLLVTVKEDGEAYTWDVYWPVTLVKSLLAKLKS